MKKTTKQLSDLQKTIVRLALPQGGEIPGPVIESLYHHWPIPKLSKKGVEVLNRIALQFGATEIYQLMDLDYFVNHGTFPNFKKLPKEIKDNMMNTKLTNAQEIILELPGIGGTERIHVIAQDPMKGITVRDFYTTLFEYFKILSNDPDYNRSNFNLWWDGITKKGRNIKGKFVPTKDNIFIVHYTQ